MPEVLKKHLSQRDGNGPQRTDGHHVVSPESLDEAVKRLGLETAIGVGDEGPGQVQYPRVALERERRGNTPSTALLQRLAKVLRVPVTALLE